MNKSTRATEKLVALCYKKLISDCRTRWSSTFLLLERLLEVRSSLTSVLEELQWDNLAASEWKTLEKIHTFKAVCSVYHLNQWRGVHNIVGTNPSHNGSKSTPGRAETINRAL